MEVTVNVRYVVVNGVVYLRLEDVCDTLFEFSETEETDVRNRGRKLIEALREMKEKALSW